MRIMKKYYGVFTRRAGTVEVEFPDIEGCHAYGFDLADAYNMAFDRLFYHLPKIEPDQIRKPSSYDDLRSRFPNEDQVILPFVIDLRRVRV